MAITTSKRRLSSALDWGVAALAAASAGFLFIAMPEPLFAGLVVKSGLPNVLAAAQPPLGGTARLAAAGAAALFAFGFVLSLLRALDRRPASASTAAETGLDGSEGVEGSASHAPEIPRLRKADAHPDAPARRPILAGRELGEPVDSAADELLLEGPEPERAPEPAYAPAALPPFLVPQDVTAGPSAEAEPEPEAPPQFDTDAEAEAAAFDAEPEADEEGETPAESMGDLSLLMERFESGLGRKRQAIVRPAGAPEAPTPVAAEAPPAAEEPGDRVGHRLRSAIADLQKVAGQGR